MEKTLSEDYCSYEVAKLIEEKGFPIGEHLYMYVNKDGKLMTDHQACLTMTNEEYRTFFDNYIPTITQSLAMKWLREECDLHIIAYPYNANGKKKWCCQVYKTFNLLGNEKYVNETLDSYEEAVEAALKYCLTNLI